MAILRTPEETLYQVEQSKTEMKKDLNKAIDALLDEELHFYKRTHASPNFMSYVRGIYYLTIAKFLNPTAYNMAWRLIEKMREDQKKDIDLNDH